MTKKIPMRTCIGCGVCKEKRELIRIVHTKDGQILIDRTGRVGGRGAYLCDDPGCLEKALRRGSISRAFGVPVPEETVRELRKAFGEYSTVGEAKPSAG